MKVVRRSSAFTLIELLAVISILGILAALSIPALKNIGQSNANVGASRQLLDDIGRARQLAVSGHKTVYMVFVATNFFRLGNAVNNTWLNGLTLAQQMEVTNLADKQLAAYNFVSYGKLGDQPGQHQWHYLASWQALPQGFYIDPQKFITPGSTPIVAISSQTHPYYVNWNTDHPHYSDQNTVYSFGNLPFGNVSPVPFPDDTSVISANPVTLPYIAFNYQGQLTFDGVTLSPRDEYIPLAQGGISYPLDPVTKIPTLAAIAPDAIAETPAGNSTNIAYNIIHIDALTGRATLEFYQMK